MRVASSYPGLAGPGTRRSADRSKPCDATALALCKARKRVRGDLAKAGSRSASRAREGKNPREHPAMAAPKCAVCREGLRGGSKPSSRGSCEPAPASVGKYPTNQRHVGSASRKRGGYLLGGESSEGRIPWALPVWNKTGPDAKGANRHEGSQTLKAERRRFARPVTRGPSLPACAVGNQSSWEVSSFPNWIRIGG